MNQDDASIPIEQQVDHVRERLETAKNDVRVVDAEIQKKENEMRTAASIGERHISNLERQAEDAKMLDEYEEMRRFQEEAAGRRAENANRLSQLEAQLGDLKGRHIEVRSRQTSAEEQLDELQDRAKAEAERDTVSEDHVRRASELEDHLERMEKERSDLVQQIEQYAPIVEAQREAASASGSEELSEAYAAQANTYKDEWQRWLGLLCAAVVIAMSAGILVIRLTHPSDDASNSEIVSRVAIEILVLGLLVYGVRVTAHQFRVHRHLEAVARSKASALMTFNRLVAGPGESEVRSAVAVALAQAVFDPHSTGFIDSSQDGVTVVERIAAPVSQRLTH